MEIGIVNTLRIARRTEFGFFLNDTEDNEVLLPNAYCRAEMEVNQNIDVFIYKDSEDRIVASTKMPIIMLGQAAFLEVNEINRIGAFVDWGLPKDLLIPYSKQAMDMKVGGRYFVTLMHDTKTDRLIGSNQLKDFKFSNTPTLQEGQAVTALVYHTTDLGLNLIVEGQYKGLIFHSDVHKRLNIGDTISCFVKTVRPDGKLDIVLHQPGYQNSIGEQTDSLIDILKRRQGFLPLTDNSAPEDIMKLVGMSKKAFKKAVGNLYKQKLISIADNGIKLLEMGE